MQMNTHPWPHACLPTYIHKDIHTCLPTNIHDFSISGFPGSIFLEFPYFQKYGNMKILEIWKSILMLHNSFVSAEQKTKRLSSY